MSESIQGNLDGARERLRPRSQGAHGRLLTARAVAERLDVSAATVLRWVRDGDLPAIRLPGGPGKRGRLRIAEDRLEEWLAARQTAPARGVLATRTDAAQ